MKMRNPVLETPWSEEPTPCVQMKASPLLWQRPPWCATYLKWAQSMIRKHPAHNYLLS